MRRYPAYKDSGVDWLGEVPEGWEVVSLKRVAALQSGETITAEAIEPEGTFPVFGGNGLRGFTEANTHDGEYVLIGRQGALCGNINYASGRFWASEHAVVVSERKPFATRWMGELLRSMNLGQYSTSAAQPGIAVEAIEKLPIPLPTLPEQQAIAEFLDREVAKIDALVAEQRRLIDLLAEKRQAVISHAVTKGLNPTTPLKPSGIDWLGDIPEGWEVVRIKNILELATSGPRGWSELLGGEEAIFFQSQNIGRSMNVDLTEIARVDPPENMDASRSSLRAEDTVVCITGARTGAVAHVNELSEPAFINQHVCLLRPKQSAVMGRWLAYCLFSRPSQEQLLSGMYGLKQGLGLEQVRAQVIALPPPIEQQKIVKHLDETGGEYSEIASAATSAIALLQERRAALISAAVTGKIDVRPVSSDLVPA